MSAARELQADNACPDTRQLVEHVTRTWGALVLRTAHPVVPPHVEYTLTTTGHEGTGLVAPLASRACHRSLA